MPAEPNEFFGDPAEEYQRLELAHVSNRHTRRVLTDLVRSSGVSGAGPQRYLAGYMRWYLGVRATAPPIRGSSLRDSTTAEFVRRRAWEQVDANRHRLPPLRDDRAA